MSALQPLLAVSTGHQQLGWALSLSGPGLGAAGVLAVLGRFCDPGPNFLPWYTAWLLLPGAFLLAGAASMCIFGALVQFPGLLRTCWVLLIAGASAWAPAILWVRFVSRAEP